MSERPPDAEPVAVTFVFQMRVDGWFRIKLGISDGSEVVSDWVPYESIALARFDGATYFAITDYFGSDLLPAETVHRVAAVNTRPEYNLPKVGM